MTLGAKKVNQGARDGGGGPWDLVSFDDVNHGRSLIKILKELHEKIINSYYVIHTHPLLH